MFQKNGDQSYEFQDADVHDDVETVVGPSVHVEGDFASEGNIIVKGTVSGSVKTSRQLTVVEGAKVLANVKAGSALVAGQIKGNVKVADRLELTESAQILGDIACSSLAVAPGALIFGKVTMKGIEGHEPKKRKTKAKKEDAAALSEVTAEPVPAQA